jgi:hypothetical protein
MSNPHTSAENVVGLSPDAFDVFDTAGDPLPPLGPPARAGDMGTFGGYRVLELVGRGGMGAVYRAVDPALGRTVALKVMLPRLAGNEVARQRFLREARAVAAIRHDHVVTVYQVGDAGYPFYAMEFLTGRSLEARLAEPLPVADAVRVARELAEGLAAAHAAGVVHRDVKPGNVWLVDQPNGPFRTKLLDFGLARVLEGDAPLTRTGTLLGTVAYMAPEQARGAGVPRSDVFGLGAVLYQMLAGRPAFDHATALRLLSEPDAWQPPPALDAVAPHLPGELCATVAVMLDPNPERRPTAGAVAEVLRAAEGQLLFGGVRPVARPAENVSHEAVTLAEGSRPSDTQTVTRPTAPARARAARRTYWLTGAAVAVALACAAAAVLHLRPAPPPPPGPRIAPPVVVTPLERAPAPHLKRTELFNGRDRTGWHAPKGTATDGWSVADGALVGTPKPTGMQWLLTDDEYGDFDLRVEYRWLEPGGHTFVAFRAIDAPADPERVVGLFVNLRDEDTLPGGEPEYPLYRTGGILTVKTPAERFARPAGEWNELRIVARGQRVRIEHNGALALEANLDEYAAKAVKLPALKWAKGHIGLCSHRWAPIAYGRVSIVPPP